MKHNVDAAIAKAKTLGFTSPDDRKLIVNVLFMHMIGMPTMARDSFMVEHPHGSTSYRLIIEALNT